MNNNPTQGRGIIFGAAADTPHPHTHTTFQVPNPPTLPKIPTRLPKPKTRFLNLTNTSTYVNVHTT